jgi:hypothetical protein
MDADNRTTETAKQRAFRVPLDHYEQPDPLVRAKLWLSLIAAGIGAAYVAWLLMGGGAGRRQASPGPLAAAHATWDRQCNVCHRDFHPLRSDAVDLAELVSGAASHREAADQACIKCHAGPPHHATMKAEEIATCAACHHDHQGQHADIVRPADKMCTTCHAAIDAHRAGYVGIDVPFANVSGFGPQLHPPFRSLTADPGNIKFNHWLHMQPGIAVADAKHQLRPDHLDERDRVKYLPQEKDGLVQLDCAACHEPASNGNMSPIAYEQHCRACHPLDVKPLDGEQSLVTVPHGLRGEQLAASLNGLLLAADQKQIIPTPPTADESGAEPLIPGKTLGKNLAQKIRADVLARWDKAAALVSAKCSECHSFQSQDGVLPEVVAANIPASWFADARFDHRAHRHVECRSCHAGAYAFEERAKPRMIAPANGTLPTGYVPATDDAQVMIAGLESCTTCHGPARSGHGGARFDCAECHLYHGRDVSLSSARNSFPGSSLGTHYYEAPASSAPRAGADLLLTPVSLKATPPAFVGAATCAAAGCHGDAQSKSPPWRTAFSTWLALDPHAHASDVLWTYRAREMTRLLATRTADATERPPISDAEHARVLQDRCVNCHATPSPTAAQPTPDSNPLGVTCESCHGPAGDWLRAHSRTSFARNSSPGFADTKDLAQRAAVCMPCHVGPKETGGQPQAVDHDVIAAGHPRLNFEFHAYFQSLPPHWNRSNDAQQHAGSFHYQTWFAGQRAQAEQLTTLTEYYQRDAKTSVLDFALLDCFACHHQLAPSQWRQENVRNRLAALTGSARLGLPQMTARPIILPDQPDPTTLLPMDRLRLAARLLARAADPAQTSWDSAVQAYLAARAIAADFSAPPKPAIAAPFAELQAALGSLGHYLSKDCFSSMADDNLQLDAYRSPASFRPSELNMRVEQALKAITNVQTALSAAP